LEPRDEVRELYKTPDAAFPRKHQAPPGRKAFEDQRRGWSISSAFWLLIEGAIKGR
jgi:hypothetical protein